MFQLLIIDDEIEILEWLKELFDGGKEEEICVYTASSGKKAIEILDHVRCDVVLTDIKMPGMDGLELYGRVKENWPMTRVVFLTGYSDHEVLYQVVQNKQVRYLMKTESPQKIVDTVWNEYRELRAYQEDLMEQNKRNVLLLKAKYWFQREIIMKIIRQELSGEEIDARIREGEFSVKSQYPVLLFLGRTGYQAGMVSSGIQEDLLFLLQEHMPGILNGAAWLLESNYVFGYVQPKMLGEYTDWVRTQRLCVGMLENVQDVFNRARKEEISFVVCEEAAQFNELGRVFFLLKEYLGRMAREPEQGVLTVGNKLIADERMDTRNSFVRIPMLEKLLEQGSYEESRGVLGEITRPLLTGRSMHDMTALQLYYKISMVFLEHIDSNGWMENVPFYIGVYPLTRVDDFRSWDEAVDYLMQMTFVLERIALESDEDNRNMAIERVEHYIREHLQEDLGLQVLAEVGSFNASYLSRIFKQKYHCNLWDYIARERIQRAKELLVETDEKIYSIGERVGYQAVGSFNRVFKKLEGMSPAEYRTRHQTGKKV